MVVDIDPKLKPLDANLLRVGIAEYLITKEFDHLCIENNIDQLWEACEKYVRNQSRVAVLVPGYTGYAEDALGLFLVELHKQGKSQFADLINKILIGFTEWSKESKDLRKVMDALLNLGFEEGEFDWVISEKGQKASIQFASQEKELQFKREPEVDRKLCFVLMPFDEKFSSIYEEIIKKTVEKFDLTCKRADEIFGTKPIMEDVWEYIQKARFLIADLTGRNPNVFYELGLAHAIQKKVILITQNLKDVPFDLKHYRCIVYEDSIAGSSKLQEGLENTIENVIKETKN